MEAVKLFTNPDFGSIRVVKSGTGDPLFVAKDVCSALGFEKPRNAVAQHVDKEDALKQGILTPGGEQRMTCLRESGVYALIFGSKLDSAKAFKHWVTSEVLPTVRKNGGYMVAREDDSADTIMARALLIANDTMKRQQAMIERQAPKVLFADAVETSHRSCLVAELAKVISQNGVQIGQNRLFVWLRENGYLCTRGEYYNQPTQRAIEMGLFEIKKTSITKPDGTILVTSTTKVTGRGQIYFTNKFLKS